MPSPPATPPCPTATPPWVTVTYAAAFRRGEGTRSKGFFLCRLLSHCSRTRHRKWRGPASLRCPEGRRGLPSAVPGPCVPRWTGGMSGGGVRGGMLCWGMESMEGCRPGQVPLEEWCLRTDVVPGQMLSRWMRSRGGCL